jgi:putative phosphonate catabolism associated alcohol dehydrogenase
MTARVAIFDGAGRPFRVEDRPLPARLDAGTVLVAVSLATICGSDLLTHAGRRVEPVPSVLGHEGVGLVVASGAGREAWRHKRITWTSTDSCGDCAACNAWGLPQKCASVFKYGHAPLRESSGLHGTYATHILLRRGTRLVEVPADVADAVAASANCSLATMVNAIAHRPASCRVAVVQGAGLLGLHGCALLRAAGVDRVIVTDTDPTRLARVRAFGGEPADLADLPTHGVDLVVEATGDPAAVTEGLRVLRPGGSYTLVGMVHPQSALHVTGEAIVRGCLTMRGVHNYAPNHLDEAVAYLGTCSLPWASLVSPPLPLARLDDAFALAATRQWARVAVSASQ